MVSAVPRSLAAGSGRTAAVPFRVTLAGPKGSVISCVAV